MIKDNTEVQVTLGPCPAGHPEASRDNNNVYGAWWVKCAHGDCSWRTAGDTEAEAITAWNTRASQPEQPRPQEAVAWLWTRKGCPEDTHVDDYPPTAGDEVRGWRGEPLYRLAALSTPEHPVTPARGNVVEAGVYESAVKGRQAFRRVYREQREIAALRLEALRAHHEWHLAQTEADGHGIVPAEAYSESALCDQTVAALASHPDSATGEG